MSGCAWVVSVVEEEQRAAGVRELAAGECASPALGWVEALSAAERAALAGSVGAEYRVRVGDAVAVLRPGADDAGELNRDELRTAVAELATALTASGA